MVPRSLKKLAVKRAYNYDLGMVVMVNDLAVIVTCRMNDLELLKDGYESLAGGHSGGGDNPLPFPWKNTFSYSAPVA